MKGQLCMFIAVIYTIFSGSNAFQSQLLFGTDKALSVLDLDVKNVTVIYNYSNNETVISIARHDRLGLIYWSVGYKLYRSRFPFLPTYPELIIEDLNGIIGIAIDDVNNHVYWCSYFNNTIKRSELDGSDTRIIINTVGPYEIALDLLNGWIFYSLIDYNNILNSGIYKCKLNGSDRQTVVQFAFGIGFVLDIAENRIYWTDQVYGFVRSAKLDGSNVTTIVQRDDSYLRSWGIDIDDNFVYFSLFNLSGKIIRVDKATGRNPVTLLVTNDSIYDINICNCEAAPTTGAPPTTAQTTTMPQTTGYTTTGPVTNGVTPTTGVIPTTLPSTTGPSTTGPVTNGSPHTTTTTGPPPTSGPPTTGAAPTTAQTTTGPQTTGSSTTRPLTNGVTPTNGAIPTTWPPTTDPSTIGPTTTGSPLTTTPTTGHPPTTGPLTTSAPPTTAPPTTVASSDTGPSTTGATPTNGAPHTTASTTTGLPTTGPPTTGPTGGTQPTTSDTTASPTTGLSPTTELPSTTPPTTSTSVSNTSSECVNKSMTDSSPGLIAVFTNDSADGQSPGGLFTTSGWISLSGKEKVEFIIKLFADNNNPVVYEVSFEVLNPEDVSNIKITFTDSDGNIVKIKNNITSAGTLITEIFDGIIASQITVTLTKSPSKPITVGDLVVEACIEPIALFPNDTVSVNVTTDLIPGPTHHIDGYEPTPSLLPVFKCTADDVANGTYIYDVYWYINGYNVTVHKNVPYRSLNITYLRTEDWNHTFKMNMKVTCAIRLRHRLGSKPGPFLYSSEFLAGIFPEKNDYTVIEGNSIDIHFTATVPVGCISSDTNVRRMICELNINLFQPKVADKNTCFNNIANRDVLFKAQFCGIKFGSLDWNETKTFQVYGYSDGLYNRHDRVTYIRLSTTAFSFLNEIWKDIQVPDIKVTIVDKDSVLQNRLCQSYNDPHITTFDGRLYHYMEVGEFVMYRNDRGPYWVHSLLTNCGFGWPGSACHCGIAIRSRTSLFVLRTCAKISRQEKYLLQHPLIKLITCAENDLLIDHTGSTYKIILPIGTEIIFTIDNWSMFISTISIKPSIYDIQKAKGFCGVPSTTRDTTDDFTHRTQGPVQDDQRFGNSWRSLKSEQLFIPEPEFLNASYVVNATITEDNNSTRFCDCERESKSGVEFQNSSAVQCNLMESTEYCSLDLQSTSQVSAFYTTCSVNINNIDKDDVLDFQPLYYDEDVNETEVPKTFRNGWTEEKARQTCTESIKNVTQSFLHSDFVDLEDENFIQSCIMDIELTGDTTFLPDTIGAIVTKIKTEASKNESLYFLKTGNGSQTLLEYITSFLCPKNCSNNGNCTSGVCSCSEGYAGDDCSKSLMTPPSNLSLSFNGLCTLSTRPCNRTNIFGEFPTTTVWARLNNFEILNESLRLNLGVEVVRADYRNMFMVSVSLGSSRRNSSTSQTKIAEGYEITLSNDGIHFGDSVTIIIYDDNCYKCNTTTTTCIDLGICQSSESNKTNASFPNEKVSVTVTTELIHGPSYNITGYEPTPSLLPVFKCTTNDVSNGTYVYDVYWYINGYNVTDYENVPYHSLNTTYLRTEDWSNTFKMNMKVTCAIRLRYRLGSKPGPFLYSSEFLAGIFPKKTDYFVTEGDFIDIVFTATVPVACFTSNPNVRRIICELNINMFQHKQADKNACSNNIVNRDILFKEKYCGIKYGSFDWNETKTLHVYGYSDGIYNRWSRSTYIRLSMSAVPPLNEFWKDLQVPDIKVTIIDKDSTLQNRLCQSFNDPHITTFDGMFYHYMEVGEFVLYKNDRGPYWVNVLLTNCGFGWAGSACHCGIAIRSRNSLFVFRTCRKISRQEKYLLRHPLIKLITCADNDLLIDNTAGSTYKITLPIGTEITFTVDYTSLFISDISVKPSIYDIQKANGLCGVPSITKDPRDDFTHRINGPIQDAQIFGDSWRSLKNEELFISEPGFLNASSSVNYSNTEDNNSARFCVCERNFTSIDPFWDFSTKQCNLTDSIEYCSLDLKLTSRVSSFFTTCSVKNYTIDNDDVLDFEPLSYDQDVNETVVPQTFKNGWTEEKARQTCMETIRNATPSYLYEDFVDLDDENFIESCVKDIQLTGDTIFLPATIGAIVIQIETEISRNESLYFLPTSDGSQSLLEYISSFLCPGNCCSNGNCTAGVCSCSGGYAGDDCSKSLSTPPSNLSLPANGLCTLSTRACDRTNIYSHFPTTTVWAKLNHFEIRNGSFRLNLGEEIVRADYRNMFMVSVRLGSSRRNRSAAQTKKAEGYEIRLSNDGNIFGDSVIIIIYDDNCYTCNSTTVICIDLGICQSSISNTTNDNNVRAIVGSVVIVLVIIVLLVCGVIYYKFKRSPKKVQIDNNNKDFSESSLPDIPVPTMHGWVKENTVLDLQRKIDENLQNTTIEIAEKYSPTYMHSAAFDFQNDDDLQLPDKSPAHAWMNKGNTVRDLWMNKEYTVSDLKLSVEERSNTAINLFEEEAPHENQSASVHTVAYGVKGNDELQPSDKPAAHAWMKKENTVSDLCMNKEYTVSDLNVSVEERSSTAIELFEDQAPEKNRPTSVHIAGSDVQNDDKLQLPNIRLVHAWMNKEITASDLKLRFEERSDTTGELFEYENPSINNFKEF